MDGFFTSKQVANPEANCDRCGLYRQCRSPRMAMTGSGKLNALIIAEAPGKDEDEQNTQLVGDAGQLLRKKLAALDIDLDRDFYKINSVNCRPHNNRKPTQKELLYCKEFMVDKAIEACKPNVILLMGSVALESFYKARLPEETFAISSWRNFRIPDRIVNAFVIPLYHPSYMLRSQGNKNIEVSYDADLAKAIEFIWSYKENQFADTVKQADGDIHVIFDVNEAINVIRRMMASKVPVMFDLETTGLKPYINDHKVFCISFSNDDNEAFCFPVDSYWNAADRTKIIKYLRAFLTSNVPKAAHNLVFEHLWNRVMFGVQTKNWFWDTCAVQHILDERPSTTGLKFQAFVRWGIENYYAKVRPYIKADSSCGLNRLHLVDIGDLCLYCGYDSLYGKKLLTSQQKEIVASGQTAAADLFIKGVEVFSDTTAEGISINPEYYQEQESILTTDINQLTAQLMESDEAKIFKNGTKRTIKLASTEDLRTLLYNLLGIKATKYTNESSNTESVDEEVLVQLNTPFANSLLALRRKLKLRDTYLAQFSRECVPHEQGAKIHPFFNLHLVKTFRSSSSRPNAQNIPARDYEAAKLTRSGIRPSPGCRLLNIDYKAQEVRIAACYTHDPILIDYINDDTTDMHRDQATDIFVLPAEQVLKDIRYSTKSDFVFPTFYGSYYVNTAKDLWKDVSMIQLQSGMTVRQHLYNIGIRGYAEFEEHVRSVEDKFWDRFHVFHEWQQRTIHDYQKTGYVEYFLGFRRYGPMKKNEIINSKIQGTAFHCLLWSYIELSDYMKSWHTKLIGQVHDSILINEHPDESKEVRSLVRSIMCDNIHDAFDFLIVPLEVEMEESEIDGNWNDLESVA
jgi:DNA polymerase